MTFPQIWRNNLYAQKNELTFFDRKKMFIYDVVGSAEDIIEPHHYTIDALVDKCIEAINKIIETNISGLKYLKGFKNKKIP
jgi:hypothetical protein